MNMILQNIFLGVLSAIGAGVLTFAGNALRKVLTMIRDFADHHALVVKQGENLTRLERKIEHVHQDMLQIRQILAEHMERSHGVRPQ